MNANIAASIIGCQPDLARAAYARNAKSLLRLASKAKAHPSGNYLGRPMSYWAGKAKDYERMSRGETT